MMMMSLTPLEFVVTPEQTLILTIYRDVRRIATDGRALSPPEDRWATAWGESVGHWEGDTLVIETVAVRQPNLFFRAPPFSEAAHYTERLRMVGPDRIEGEMTIEDPEALTAPWTVKQAYVRAEGLDHLVMTPSATTAPRSRTACSRSSRRRTRRRRTSSAALQPIPATVTCMNCGLLGARLCICASG